MTTTAAIAMYVSIGRPPVGGGAVVGVDVGATVGEIDGKIVAVGVGVTCGLAGGAVDTLIAVSADDGQ